jgi:hypothetical protein
MKKVFTGVAKSVLVAPDPQTLVSEARPEIEISQEGVVGDRHFGLLMRSDGRTPRYPRGTVIRNARQVSLVSVEEMRQAAAALGIPEVRAEWLGANILVEGIEQFTQLPASTRLYFEGGVTLVVNSDNLPCKFIAKVIQGQHPGVAGLEERVVPAFMGLRGVVAWVEKAGVLRAGERFEAEIRG